MTLMIAVFLVTMALCTATFLMVQKSLKQRDAAKVRDRLVGRAPAAGREDSKALPLFVPDTDQRSISSRLLSAFNVERGVTNLIEQAGVNLAPGQVVLAILVLMLVSFNIAWYLAPEPLKKFSFAVVPVAGYLPIAYLRLKRTRRIRAFESQFPDSLLFIARAMRAGHAFSVSLEMLHKEFDDPLGAEFRRTFEEQNLGLPLDVALEKLAKRVPLMDVQFFVAAVLLQKRTGGNLAEILDKLASLIRERFKLRGQIRSISAHGRMSSLVLTAIPTVVGIMMYFVHREHMMFFVEEEIGQWMIGMALALQAVGYFIMKQIVKIEV